MRYLLRLEASGLPKTPNNPKGIRDVPIRTTTTNDRGERDVLSKQDFATLWRSSSDSEPSTES